MTTTNPTPLSTGSETANPIRTRRAPISSQASRKGTSADHGHGHALEDVPEQFVRTAAAEARLGGENEAVRQDVRGHRLDVIGEDVIAAGDGGEGAGGAEEGEAGSRAGPEFEGAVAARLAHEAHGI